MSNSAGACLPSRHKALHLIPSPTKPKATLSSNSQNHQWQQKSPLDVLPGGGVLVPSGFKVSRLNHFLLCMIWYLFTLTLVAFLFSLFSTCANVLWSYSPHQPLVIPFPSQSPLTLMLFLGDYRACVSSHSYRVFVFAVVVPYPADGIFLALLYPPALLKFLHSSICSPGLGKGDTGILIGLSTLQLLALRASHYFNCHPLI